jgi:hypothetical protein
MGSRARNSTGRKARSLARKGKRSPTPPKPAPKGGDSNEPGEALSKLSTAIALVETISFAMQIHEDEPDFGSIAASLEVAVCKLGMAYSEIDLALMRATP